MTHFRDYQNAGTRTTGRSNVASETSCWCNRHKKRDQDKKDKKLRAARLAYAHALNMSVYSVKRGLRFIYYGPYFDTQQDNLMDNAYIPLLISDCKNSSALFLQTSSRFLSW